MDLPALGFGVHCTLLAAMQRTSVIYWKPEAARSAEDGQA